MKTFGRYLAESGDKVFCSHELIFKLESLSKRCDFEEHLGCVLANQAELKLPAPDEIYIDGALGADIVLCDMLDSLDRNAGLLWPGRAGDIARSLAMLFKLGARLWFKGEKVDAAEVVKWLAGKLGENDANVKKIRAYMLADELDT